MFIYLDNSSTTKPYDQVASLMGQVLKEDFGNPSSLHTLGMTAEKYIKSARRALAQSLGASEDEVVFLSCGTEADNTALFGAAKAGKHRGNKIITSAVEHPAVLEAVRSLEKQGFEAEYIGVDSQCRLDMDQLKNALTEDTLLISIMAVNNEIGTIMPLEEIIALKDQYSKDHQRDILLHTDAVQGYGKIPLMLEGNLKGIDMISVSGHKIHGPKGIGALYIKKGLAIPPYMVGGGQESNMRSGTENTPAIAGFGKAIDLCFGSFKDRISAMEKARDHLLQGLVSEVPDIVVNTPTAKDSKGNIESSPSVLNVSFLGTRGEVILHTLEQEGIFVSTGSACSSNKKGQSHVLEAMGLGAKEIQGAIRFSLSEFNTIEEMEYVTEKVKKAVTSFRRLGSFR